jgi:hypothetical protein
MTEQLVATANDVARQLMKASQDAVERVRKVGRSPRALQLARTVRYHPDERRLVAEAAPQSRVSG